MQSSSLLNLGGEFRSFNNQIDTKCMQLVSIWSNVLQRVLSSIIPLRKNFFEVTFIKILFTQ